MSDQFTRNLHICESTKNHPALSFASFISARISFQSNRTFSKLIVRIAVVGIMLGLGETEEELLQAMRDLRSSNCDILTLGQYLQPTLKHLPVVEFVTPAKFAEYKVRAEEMGFVHVASGPMVRSSYHADEDFAALRDVRAKQLAP